MQVKYKNFANTNLNSLDWTYNLTQQQIEDVCAEINEE